MRRATLLALIAAAPVAGCGGGGDGDKDQPAAKPVDPIEVAATATGKKGAAKAKIELVPHHLGVPEGIKLAGDGTVSLSRPSAEYRFDLSDVLGIAGLLTGTDLKVLLDGETVYADPPDIPVADIPEGWLSASNANLARALDPAGQLRALADKGGLAEVGREKIDGVSVRHFRGENANVWIDEQDVLRRIRLTIELPGGNGPQPGTLDVTTDLGEFGATLDTEAPADATDITKTVDEILRSPDTLGTSGSRGG